MDTQILVICIVKTVKSGLFAENGLGVTARVGGKSNSKIATTTTTVIILKQSLAQQ